MPTKNRQQTLVIAALVIIGLFVVDQFAVEPLVKLWKTRETRLAQVRTDITQGRALVQRERGIRNYWRDISGRTLTNNPSAAEHLVFQAVDRWAQGSGAVIAGINPQWKRDSEDSMTYECHVDATGDLRRLSSFLYNVEKETMAIRLQSIELTARDKDGQQLALALQFSGLVLTPQKQ